MDSRGIVNAEFESGDKSCVEGKLSVFSGKRLKIIWLSSGFAELNTMLMPVIYYVSCQEAWWRLAGILEMCSFSPVHQPDMIFG